MFVEGETDKYHGIKNNLYIRIHLNYKLIKIGKDTILTLNIRIDT